MIFLTKVFNSENILNWISMKWFNRINNGGRIVIAQFVVIITFVILFLGSLYFELLLKYPEYVSIGIGIIIIVVNYKMGKWCKVW